MNKTDTAMRFILIPVVGPVEIIETDQAGSYEAISGGVGGYIEAVTLGDTNPYAPGHTLYLDEEGKLKHLPVNGRATIMTRRQLPASDLIVGPVVLAGPVDEQGWDTSVTDQALVRALLAC